MDFTQFAIGRAFARPVGLTHPDCRLICSTGQANQFDFAGHRDARPAQNVQNRVRLKTNFLSGFKLIGVVSPAAKISLSENRKLW
jgi:hypothetical protein